MEIKSFLPFIITNESEKIKKYFEQIGFSQAHGTLDVSPTHNDSYNLKDENGNQVQRINTSKATMVCGIRINVENFEESVDSFKNMGFEAMMGGLTETSFSKSVMMRSPEFASVSYTKSCLRYHFTNCRMNPGQHIYFRILKKKAVTVMGNSK